MNPRSHARRRVLAGLICLPLWSALPAAGQAGKTRMEVWKGPDCECCNDWIKHLEAAGFEIRAHQTGNTDIRAKLGIPVRYGSCHTGQVGGYAIEGHVPATDIRKLLKQRPAAAGIAVPGMPIGSPGMDGKEYGSRRDPYDVLLVRRDGSTSIFTSYR